MLLINIRKKNNNNFNNNDINNNKFPSILKYTFFFDY